ncbi:MAG: phospholipase D-like domain-containing protein [Pseudomonadales bacterium]|nr:phospholipase D-like domain-containing protein [Pseudomonadales bacterium]
MNQILNLLLAILIEGTSVYFAIHALLSKRDSKSALAWVVFCMIPIIGPITYLVFGINRFKDKAKETYHPTKLHDDTPCIDNPNASSSHPYCLIGQSVTKKGLHSCDEIQLLENGEACFDAMLDDIGKATDRIFLSTYIFQKDYTGEKFIQSLTAAKERGVDVRIIIDGLASIVYPPSALRKLRKSGLRFELFNPLRFFPPSLHINMRNHRKILVVDGKLAYTGGQNISDRHRIDLPHNPKCARDLHFRLTGKIVDDLERAFLTDWNHCTIEDDQVHFTPSNQNQSESDVWTRLILDGPSENLDQLNEVLNGIVAVAQKRVWIMTPYFLPFPELVGALQSALHRGVDVKIFLPERTNIHLAHYAAQHNLKQILAKNLPVYLQPAPFVHTKAILIDHTYSLIGSANLDPRSLRLNFELGVEVFSIEFAAQLESYFKQQLAESTQLVERELTNMSFPIRLRNAAAWLFSPYL